ncbi:MAG: ribonuclease Z [Clostridia bacterium]|nr:ribonuclease Z [Clostridia bacterium]
MKITFLGTSHGVPEASRKCSCIMFEIAGNIYFVDMGTPVVEQLRKRGKSADAVKGVFITHMHGDHTDGLVQFVDLLTWYFKTPDPTIVLSHPEIEVALNLWLTGTQAGREKKINYQKVEEGVVFDDGVLKVTAIPTKHCPGSFAYLLEAEGKTVLCTGDLSRPSEDFPYVDKKLDLMICESAHFPATDYLPVLDRIDVKKICVTHYSPRRMLSLYQFQQAMAEREQPIIIATDDLEIDL